MKGHAVYLTHARELAGISQSELAREVGVWQGAISRLELVAGAGARHDTHLKICTLLNLDPYQLKYGPPPNAERRAHERRLKERRSRQRREWHTEIAEAVS